MNRNEKWPIWQIVWHHVGFFIRGNKGVSTFKGKCFGFKQSGWVQFEASGGLRKIFHSRENFVNCMHFQSFCFSGKNSLFLSSKLEVVRNFPNDDVLNAKRLKPRGGQYNAAVSVANFLSIFPKNNIGRHFQNRTNMFLLYLKSVHFSDIRSFGNTAVTTFKVMLMQQKKGRTCL